jgi:hypothetical protein
VLNASIQSVKSWVLHRQRLPKAVLLYYLRHNKVLLLLVPVFLAGAVITRLYFYGDVLFALRDFVDVFLFICYILVAISLVGWLELQGIFRDYIAVRAFGKYFLLGEPSNRRHLAQQETQYRGPSHFPACRNAKWVIVRADALVAGDVVKMAVGDIAPALMESINDPSITIACGENVMTEHFHLQASSAPSIPEEAPSTATAVPHLSLSRSNSAVIPPLDPLDEDQPNAVSPSVSPSVSVEANEATSPDMASWPIPPFLQPKRISPADPGLLEIPYAGDFPFRACFRLRESALNAFATEFLEARTARPVRSSPEADKLSVTTVAFYVIAITLCLGALAVSLLRLILYRQLLDGIVGAFEVPLVLIMLLAPYQTNLLLTCLNLYASARLEAEIQMDHVLQWSIPGQAEISEYSPEGYTSDDSLSDNEDIDAGSSSFSPTYFRMTLQNCLRLAVGRPRELDLDPNLCDTLGQVTSVCFTDHEGVLTYPYPSLDKVIFFKQDGEIGLVDIEYETDDKGNEIVAANCIGEYRHALKALALNCMLMNPSSFPHKYIHPNDTLKALCPDMYPSYVASDDTPFLELGLAVGMNSNVAASFEFVREDIAVFPSVSSETVPFMVSCSLQGRRGRQLMSKGHLQVILAHCTQYWNGEGLVPLDKAAKDAVLAKAAEQRGCSMLGFAFKGFADDSQEFPVLPQDFGVHVTMDLTLPAESSTSDGDPPLHHSIGSGEEGNTLFRRLHADQIFLGIVGTALRPFAGVPKFIESLNAAGVRFVFFSPFGLNRSKDMAAALVLDTDWNSSISLKENDQTGGDDYWRQQMPCGVSAVRQHIAAVDDIPLRIPLFFSVSQEASAGMVEVLRENGHIVATVGSDLQIGNAKVWGAADIGIGWRPSGFASLRRPGLAKIGASVCLDGRYHSLSLFLSLLFVARRLVTLKMSAVSMAMQLVELLLGFYTLSLAAGLPGAFTGLQALYFSGIVVPTLTFSCIWAAPTRSYRTRIPELRPLQPQKPGAFAGQVARTTVSHLFWLPLSLALVAIYLIAFVMFLPADGNVWDIIWISPNVEQRLSVEYRRSVLIAQAMGQFVLVLYMVWTAMIVKYPLASLHSSIALRSWTSWTVYGMIILLQLGWLIATMVSTACWELIRQEWITLILPLLALLIFVGGAVVFWVAHEVNKRQLRRRTARSQKRLQLDFETKLGLHSPIMATPSGSNAAIVGPL